MKGFVYVISCFFVLIFIFCLFLINYKANLNIIFYQNEILDYLKQKEDIDFIITGLKIIAKNSRTKEEFIKNMGIWSLKAGIEYKLDDLFIDNCTVYFYSNNSLFKNYLKIIYKGKKYVFNNISY